MTLESNMPRERDTGEGIKTKTFATWLVRFGIVSLAILSFPVFGMNSRAIVLSEFISDAPPTPQSHASTIVETPAGLAVAWFGGTKEGDPSVGIWLSRRIGKRWTRPLEVANGVRAGEPRLPCWNPVLFKLRGGPLMLFYKVGPDPAHWWGMLKISKDNGRHWSVARRLHDGFVGPVKDKPLQLADGSLVSPSSEELGQWRTHFEQSIDNGRTWSLSHPIANPQNIEAIQPSLLRWSNDNLQAIGRTKQDRLFSTHSKDGGISWSTLKLTDVPNPNSGIDAVMLADHRALLVYNPTQQGPKGRNTLSVALSDDGEHWKNVLTLEDDSAGEYSYPAVIQTRDGLVNITYTWRRLKIKHVVVDPDRL